MRQNLGWAIGYNSVALPIAAGIFEPAFGLVLRPEIAALAMSGSSFLVAVNALLLRRFPLHRAALYPRGVRYIARGGHYGRAGGRGDWQARRTADR
jgi:Cu2+-exporting ATPase